MFENSNKNRIGKSKSKQIKGHDPDKAWKLIEDLVKKQVGKQFKQTNGFVILFHTLQSSEVAIKTKDEYDSYIFYIVLGCQVHQFYYFTSKTKNSFCVKKHNRIANKLDGKEQRSL